jgi:dipeptidyl aminopeptidase/acylaminoacyl peptidase
MPFTQVSGLILHGDNDEVVSLEQSARLYAQLVEAGVPAKLCVEHGAAHRLPEFNTPEIRAIIREFFGANLRPGNGRSD